MYLFLVFFSSMILSEDLLFSSYYHLTFISRFKNCMVFFSPFFSNPTFFPPFIAFFCLAFFNRQGRVGKLSHEGTFEMVLPPSPLRNIFLFHHPLALIINLNLKEQTNWLRCYFSLILILCAVAGLRQDFEVSIFLFLLHTFDPTTPSSHRRRPPSLPNPPAPPTIHPPPSWVHQLACSLFIAYSSYLW